jgi:hypothetical protein
VWIDRPPTSIEASSSRSSRTRSDLTAPSLGTCSERAASSRTASPRMRAADSSPSGSANWRRMWPPGMRRLSSSGVPSATSRPWSSSAIRSASSSASSRYWVVRKIVTPPATRSRMICHMVRRLRGSRPVVGSSRKTIRGSPIRPMARSSRRRMPPEKVAAGFLAVAVRSNRSSSSAARRRRWPPRWCRSAISSRFSSPVSRLSTAVSWPVTPIAARTASGSRARSWPATRTSPPSAPIRMDRMCTVVVLPAPLGPSSAKIVPSGTSRSMPSSTTWSPNDLRSPAAAIAGRDGMAIRPRLVAVALMATTRRACPRPGSGRFHHGFSRPGADGRSVGAVGQGDGGLPLTAVADEGQPDLGAGSAPT